VPLEEPFVVSTDSAAAPAASYARACAGGSKCVRMTPRDGEARFTSAMARAPARRERSAEPAPCSP